MTAELKAPYGKRVHQRPFPFSKLEVCETILSSLTSRLSARRRRDCSLKRIIFILERMLVTTDVCEISCIERRVATARVLLAVFAMVAFLKEASSRGAVGRVSSTPCRTILVHSLVAPDPICQAARRIRSVQIRTRRQARIRTLRARFWRTAVRPFFWPDLADDFRTFLLSGAVPRQFAYPLAENHHPGGIGPPEPANRGLSKLPLLS